MIDAKASIKRAREFIRTWNGQWVSGVKPDGSFRYDLKRSLRAGHQQLLFTLLSLYARQIEKDLGVLAPFRTRLTSLGAAANCSARTVRNQLDRLMEAGAVLSVATGNKLLLTEIELNPELLALSDRKTFRPLHTLSTNKKNLGCGLNFEEKKKLGNSPSQPAAPKPDPSKRSPKLCGPSDSDPGLSGPVQGSEGVHNRTLRLFSLCMATVFSPLEWLSESQAGVIWDFFEKELTEAPSEKQEAVYQELRSRIILADNYRKRKPHRFVPLPSVWLDRENLRGFAGTATWFAAMRDNTEKAEALKLRYRRVMKGWAGFMDVVGQYLAEPGLDSFLAGRKRIQQSEATLAKAYDYVILSEWQS